MFDRADQQHLDDLKAEVVNDPLGMGYIAGGGLDVRRVLHLLNDPSRNKGMEQVERPFTVRVLLENLHPEDYASLSPECREYLQLFLRMSPDVVLVPIIGHLEKLFPASSATHKAVKAFLRMESVRNRAASRAEILFGDDVEITRGDLIAARDKGVA